MIQNVDHYLFPGKITYDSNQIGVRKILKAIRDAGFQVEIPNKVTY